MYQHKLPGNEELLDSTTGYHVSTDAAQYSYSSEAIGDAPDSERPAKRIRHTEPVHWGSPPQHSPASMEHAPHHGQGASSWPLVQPVIFSPSNNSDLAGDGGAPSVTSHNFQHVQQPPTVTPVPAPQMQPDRQSRFPASKHRRGSVRSEDASSNHSQPHRESPFKDSRGTVGIRSFHIQGYAIERDALGNGKVSSYIKFQWPSTSKREIKPPKPAQQPLDHYMTLFRGGDGRRSQLEIMGLGSSGGPSSAIISPAPMVGSANGVFDEGSAAHSHRMDVPQYIGTPWSGHTLMGNAVSTAHDASIPLTPSSHGTPAQLSSGGSLFPSTLPAGQILDANQRGTVNMGPMLLPEQFGLPTKLEDYQRRFMNFYIKAWCPGRSILKQTNVWLRDFVPMSHYNEYIRSAMDSLVGVYIFDYTSAPSVSDHTNQAFDRADARLTELLNKPQRSSDEDNETITIMVLLAMQDVVFVERRKKFHERPRWLEGFKECERLLQAMDPRERFWDRTTDVPNKIKPEWNLIQVDPLQLSLSICVCRAVILAQPLMPLPDPKTFDSEREADRFGWLLTGGEADMFAIHGGCGFSKILLYQFSQVTFLAAKLRQDGAGTYSYIYAETLLEELSSMRQYSKESLPGRNTWEAAKQQRPVIDWVREQNEDFIIVDSREDMTDVTAEAWRIAAMIYLQCRALRLPREHAQVVSNISDLAACIRMMPTSGPLFTAQAPLLPVFLLGLLAIDPTHKQVSRQWFEDVVSAPVRSSVPPLFDALKNIWEWIDKEIPTGRPMHKSVPRRDAWWERLVAVVKKTQKETLCLT